MQHSWGSTADLFTETHNIVVTASAKEHDTSKLHQWTNMDNISKACCNHQSVVSALSLRNCLPIFKVAVLKHVIHCIIRHIKQMNRHGIQYTLWTLVTNTNENVNVTYANCQCENDANYSICKLQSSTSATLPPSLGTEMNLFTSGSFSIM